jgi:FlaG/FlaF family flagellin (archaellin)
MHLLKRRAKRKGETAVSPVLGVMLMIVIVVIIAAVVSGFAGGLVAKSNQKAPTLTMDVKVINTGTWQGSGFFAAVTGVSEPIPTKDLKIVTAWSAKNIQVTTSVNIANISGNVYSTMVLPGGNNTYTIGNPEVALSDGLHAAPFGAGPGVNGSATLGGVDTNITDYSGPLQQFGNYTLMPGTTLSAPACGAEGSLFGYGATTGTTSDRIGATGRYAHQRRGITALYNNPTCAKSNINSCYGPYRYRTLEVKKNAGSYYASYGEGAFHDPVTAMLGLGWESLRAGDTVNVKVIHLPTGKVIFDQDVAVKEA